MTLLTIPQGRIPIGSAMLTINNKTQRIQIDGDPEWIRFFSALAERAGGVSGTPTLGPASSTDNAIARFDGATGGLIQGSDVTLSDTGEIASLTLVVADNTVTTEASGNLSATELNAALAELQADIDTRSSGSAIYAFAAAHG